MLSKQAAIERLLSVTEDNNSPVFLGPAGEIFRFTRQNHTTNGSYLMAKAIIPSGAGPQPHIHLNTNEWFYTPREGISLFIGDGSYKSYNTIPGASSPKDHVSAVSMSDNDLKYVHEGTVHGFVNNTRHDLELYFVWTHGSGEVKTRMFEYFNAVSERLDRISPTPEPLTINKIKFVSEAHRHGILQSTAFWDYVSGVSYAGRPDDENSFQYLIQVLDRGDSETDRSE